jgi:hypothetical protein
LQNFENVVESEKTHDPMIFISAKKAKIIVASALSAAKFQHLKNDDPVKHLLLVDEATPASQIILVNTVYYRNDPGIYKMARSITDRQPRENESWHKDNKYIFSPYPLRKNAFLSIAIYLYQNPTSLPLLLRKQKNEFKPLIIKETIRSVDGISHAIELNEILSIVKEGKKFIAATNPANAEVMKEIFGDEMETVFFFNAFNLTVAQLHEKLTELETRYSAVFVNGSAFQNGKNTAAYLHDNKAIIEEVAELQSA